MDNTSNWGRRGWRLGCGLMALVAAGLSVWALSAQAAQAAPSVAASTQPAANGTPLSGANQTPLIDPSGEHTGTIRDIPAAQRGAPTAAEIADAVGHNHIALNIVWVLFSGFLVMLMSAGFALVETGLTRAKNAAHTMAMNFLIYPLAMLGFYVCGFAFMWGGVASPHGLAGGVPSLGGCAALNVMCSIPIGHTTIDLLGFKGFFLGPSVYDVGVFTLFLFAVVFLDTAATIPTGALAERWKFSAFILYGLAVGTIIYPVYGCWVWGGGWLADLGRSAGLGHGHVDFAGSSVVHLTGGVLACVGAWFIGPRTGKYNRDGTANGMPAHSLPMALLGTLILAFSWFGFNCGSSLAGTDVRIAVVATNTMLASATGALAATFWVWWFRTRRPDPSMMCNGMLAGLVAITAPSAFINSQLACVIGLIAGVLVVESVFLFDRVFHIDDPVGAISVHGVNGAWGAIALGLFADGTYGENWNGVPGKVTGLFYGNGSQLAAQCVGVLTNLVYVGLVGLLVFWLIEKIVGNRVEPDVEIEGLDIPEMGTSGYNGLVMDKASETPFSR